MKHTRYLQVDAWHPQAWIIEAAARYIRAGELVAFPTETVYGLGADVFQPGAVEKIFQAKGRPSERALLVHISNQGQVNGLVREIPAVAQKLMDRFWPGPLSIILPARPTVPEIVRGGTSGVGLRMPSHPVALALIEATGPLAAPSANLYGRPSPTSALHVRQDLDGKIAAVLDAGDTGAGLESTLIDLTTTTVKVLRRGGIPVEDLEAFLGQKIGQPETELESGYRTNLQVILSHDQADFDTQLAAILAWGGAVGVVFGGGAPVPYLTETLPGFELRFDGLGMTLYAILREAEVRGLTTLLVAPLDTEQVGAATMDRLRRAAKRQPV